MSIRNQRTGRHEDDFMDKRCRGTATVGDLIEHAQEIIVEVPEAFGTVVSEPVSLLLKLIDVLSSGEEHEVHQHDKLVDLFEE